MFLRNRRLITSILLLFLFWLPFFFLAGTSRSGNNEVDFTQGKAVVLDLGGTITPTPFPPEYLTNRDQTIGILIGGIILILIVIIGTLTTIRRKRQQFL